MEKDQCSNCKFWKEPPPHVDAWFGYGWCQRYPPRKMFGEYDSSLKWDTGDNTWSEGIFPLLRDNDWCGEWEGKG